MSEVNRIVALLDANVLYPAPLRDFLLRLAEADLFFQNGQMRFTMSGLEIC